MVKETYDLAFFIDLPDIFDKFLPDRNGCTT